uniref:Protein KTI12 homolog n=1 Tax=Timema tahoe TaxID=61484 RepID=A0A7R9IGB2_9NEOP|nr:unnamed protein product [Timema tahoe]
MPLILMTGIPSSGKTTRTLKLKSYFEDELKSAVHVVSENILFQKAGIDKNTLFLDSSKEKEIRGLIKAETQRLIGRESVVIIDAGNYIKGYRYELYCMSKSSKTTQCTIQCETSADTARQWNEGRGDDTYSQDVFDALIMRYEAPDSRNRWDSPLFLVLPSDGLPLEQIQSALFDRKAPPPNQSTQCAPLSSTNFLYDLDRVTQDIVSAILSAQKLGLEGEIKLPGYQGCVLIPDISSLTPSQLARLRRQFLAYTKLHPTNDVTKLAPLFVQFLNTSLQ